MPRVRRGLFQLPSAYVYVEDSRRASLKYRASAIYRIARIRVASRLRMLMAGPSVHDRLIPEGGCGQFDLKQTALSRARRRTYFGSVTLAL